MQIDELGEFGLIARIARQLGTGDASVIRGVGDDAAALRPRPGRLLLATCDSQVEGRHFLRSQISAEQLGHRLAAVNLSDIGSMGGQPRWALVSLILPTGIETAFVEELYRGLITELGRFGALIVGGNLSRGDRLVLDLTLLGEVDPALILRRDGARPGDAILVTGALGASAAGRAALGANLTGRQAEAAISAHLMPRARVREGMTIAATHVATAMADVSDGLGQDLGHICDASKVGAIVEAKDIPLAPATLAVAHQLGLDPLALALSGGEDYELLLTAPDSHVRELSARLQHTTGTPLTRIGHVETQAAGRRLRKSDGRLEPLPGRGWQHFGN